MTRDELFDLLVSRPPEPGEMFYVARQGDDYQWRALPSGEPLAAPVPGEPTPDAWMYHTSAWPAGDPGRELAYFDDLIAEMDNMAGANDRCRWDLDDPWGHRH